MSAPEDCYINHPCGDCGDCDPPVKRKADWWVCRKPWYLDLMCCERNQVHEHRGYGCGFIAEVPVPKRDYGLGPAT